MLIINDMLPPSGHDPVYITEQLSELKESSGFSCLLLDFQREGCTETAKIAKHISLTMDCPVGISEAYAHCCDGPAFLNCAQPHCSLSEKLKLWNGRELWLEAVLEAETTRIYRDHCQISFVPYSSGEDSDSECDVLRCRYRILHKEDHVELLQYRDIPQLEKLLYEAKDLGVTKAIGLFQQLGASAIAIA